MSKLSVIILTLNEERHISRAIRSVQSIAHEILVVDSGSIDETTNIARSEGVRVLYNTWINYSDQFQWACANIDGESSWVMRLDADEYISADLANAIEIRLRASDDEVTGLILQRKHIFMGRWIRFGGRYPLKLLRVWRVGSAKIETRWMDEHIVLQRGVAVVLSGGFYDENFGDLSFFIKKHNAYATREALDVIMERHQLGTVDLALLKTDRGQAMLKRLFKSFVYNRLPFAIGPMLYFAYRYILQFGFLDGKPGFVYHFMQGLWYRMLVDVKVFELELGIKYIDEKSMKMDALQKITGLNISGFG